MDEVRGVKDRSCLVVVLNWNGWRDTIECVRSLLNANIVNTHVLIFDNGSTDNSLQEIRAALSVFDHEMRGESRLLGGRGVTLDVFQCGDSVVKLLSYPQNVGFARGCNLGVEYASLAGYAFSILLNNDTVVTRDAFNSMMGTLDSSQANLVIPQIRFFDEPSIIWNCGGEVSRFGRVSYYWSGQSKGSDFNQPFWVGFATGCCILMRTDFFLELGGFTERFFFGEEDVELSFRLKRLRRRVICDPRAIVYHKVSASLRGDPSVLLRKTYLHCLNRMLNMRSFMAPPIWFIWRRLYSLKIYISIYRKCLDPHKFVRDLMRDSAELNGVDRTKFEEIMRTNTHGIHARNIARG